MISEKVRSGRLLLNISIKADARPTDQRSLARANSARKAFVACTLNIALASLWL